jgi:hypothetical protein
MSFSSGLDVTVHIRLLVADPLMPVQIARSHSRRNLRDPTRAIPHEVEDIERRLQTLQRGIEKLGIRASSNARDTAAALSEAVASALSNWADRFRDGKNSLGDRSAVCPRPQSHPSRSAPL